MIVGEQRGAARARARRRRARARSSSEQRERIDEALAEFAENTVAHVRQETDLLTGGIEFPPTRTSSATATS